MGKFRKKPVVIEAVQYLNPGLLTAPYDEMCRCLGSGRHLTGHIVEGFAEYIDAHGRFLIIPTLEGNHRASLGDWIITGVKGEKYPCKSDIFELTYEEVKDE